MYKQIAKQFNIHKYNIYGTIEIFYSKKCWQFYLAVLEFDAIHDCSNAILEIHLMEQC